MICQSWKVMFHAEYSAGSPLRMLVDLRNVVDAALARTTKKAPKAKSQPSAPRAKAAVAAAQFTSASSDVPEFQVNSAPEWDENSSDVHQPSDDEEKV
jgi:glycogen debranching enzyme